MPVSLLPPPSLSPPALPRLSEAEAIAAGCCGSPETGPALLGRKGKGKGKEKEGKGKGKGREKERKGAAAGLAGAGAAVRGGASAD